MSPEMFKILILGGFGSGQVRAAFLAALNPVFSTVGRPGGGVPGGLPGGAHCGVFASFTNGNSILTSVTILLQKS